MCLSTSQFLQNNTCVEIKMSSLWVEIKKRKSSMCIIPSYDILKAYRYHIHTSCLSLPVCSVWIRFSIILWTVEVFIIKATIFQNMIKHKWKKNDTIWILDIVTKIFIFLYFEYLSSSKSQIYRTSGVLSSNKVASYCKLSSNNLVLSSDKVASYCKFYHKKKHLASMLSLLTNIIFFPYLPQYSETSLVVELRYQCPRFLCLHRMIRGRYNLHWIS